MRPLAPWQVAVLRALGALLAPGGRRGALLVLIFHRVLEEPDPLLPSEPDAALFAAQMDIVAELCNVLPLAEAVERLRAGTLPPRAACITFDDGYANNRTVAAPLLKERSLPATVFIATAFLGGGRMWNDTVIEAVRRAGERLDLTPLGLPCFTLGDTASRRAAIDATLGALKYRPPAEREAAAARIASEAGGGLPENLMMSPAQVRELSSLGIEVGAHTLSHPILTRLGADEAWREIAGSREALEGLIGGPVRAFAYPNGSPQRDYGRAHVEMVRKAGFSLAVSTAWGVATATTDPFQIPRALPWERSPTRFGARLLALYRQVGAGAV